MITSNRNVIDYIAKWPVIMITLWLLYEDYILKLAIQIKLFLIGLDTCKGGY